MKIEIVDQPLKINIFGFSAVALRKDYVETAFQLMNKMWKTVKANGLKNKGLNTWIYDQNDKVFAGIELEKDIRGQDFGLEHKTIVLKRYAYYKHLGPYSLLKQVGQVMTDELKQKGFETSFPYIEIYGHWTEDETKLETELLMSLT